MVTSFIFQYYVINDFVEDVENLTIEQALDFWDKYIENFKNRVKDGVSCEIAIWISTKEEKYKRSFMHLGDGDCKIYSDRVFLKI